MHDFDYAPGSVNGTLLLFCLRDMTAQHSHILSSGSYGVRSFLWLVSTEVVYEVPVVSS
jgi:hypothetical protein